VEPFWSERRASERRVTPSIIPIGLWRKISWSGVFAGSVLAVAIQMMMGVLGEALGIGLFRQETAGASMLWALLSAVASFVPKQADT
jgi:hypothetical protein